MSFKIEIGYKETMIFKHSLESKIEADKEKYERYKKYSDSSNRKEREQFIKDHEEHISCLDKLENKITEEFKREREDRRKGKEK